MLAWVLLQPLGVHKNVWIVLQPLTSVFVKQYLFGGGAFWWMRKLQYLVRPLDYNLPTALLRGGSAPSRSSFFSFSPPSSSVTAHGRAPRERRHWLARQSVEFSATVSELRRTALLNDVQQRRTRTDDTNETRATQVVRADLNFEELFGAERREREQEHPN